MELRRILLLTIFCLGLFIFILQITTLSAGHWRNLHVFLKDIQGRQNNYNILIFPQDPRIIVPVGLWTLGTSYGNGAGAIGIISLLLLGCIILLTFLQFLHVVGKMENSYEFGCYFEKVGIEFFSLLLAIICPIVYSFENSTFPDINQAYVIPTKRPDKMENGWSLDLQMALCVFHGLLLVLTILETLHRYHIFFPKVDEDSKVESVDPIGNPGFKTSSPKSKEKHLDNTFSPDGIKVEQGEFINTGFRSSSPKLQPKLQDRKGNGQLSLDPKHGMEDIKNPTFSEDPPKRPPRHVESRQDSLVSPKTSDLSQISEGNKSDVEKSYLELDKPKDPITLKKPESENLPPVYAMVKNDRRKNNENLKNHEKHNLVSSKGKIYNPPASENKKDSSKNFETDKSPKEFTIPNDPGFDNNNLPEVTPKGLKKSISVAINSSAVLHETDL